MNGAGNFGHRAERIAVAIMLLALLLMRGAVPPGMMPMASDGWLSIEICPSSVLAQLPRDKSMSGMGMHGSDDTHDTHNEDHVSGWDCPFGSLMASAILPYVAPVLTLIQLTSAEPPAWRDGLNLGTAAPLPPSTGPPPFS